MIIIGITGTLGAGKGTIVEYLVKERGFRHYSVREFITREIQKRGLAVNRDTLTAVANDLRATHGASFIIESLYQEAEESKQNSVIESIRAVGEITAMRKYKNFTLFAVDADPHTRYERISRRRSETDHISYEQFLSDENRESTSDDPAKQNLPKCIALADYVFHNDEAIEELQSQVEVTIKNILKHGG